MKFRDLVKGALSAALLAKDEDGRLSVRQAIAHFRRRLEAANAIPEAVPNPDGKLLADEIETLTGLLDEIDQLSKALPDDARPIGLAARSLVEKSLEECQKPVVNAAQLARDMQQVSALALAMRERLLLSPGTKKTLPS